MSLKPDHQHYDVVIIGAGMVGLSLACMLEQKLHAQDSKILLLESKPLTDGKASQPGFDARSTVLSYGTVQQLQQFDLWPVLQDTACPIHTIHVSDQGHFGQSLIQAEEEKVPALGYVLENQDIGRALNQKALRAERLEILSPVQVNVIRHEESQAVLECQREATGFALSAALVVLAEGGRSGLCETLGINRQQTDYGQVGIIANLAFSEAHHQVAYERFTRQGPLAILPLNDFQGLHRGALIWTQAAANYEEVLAMHDEAFLAKLQNEFGHRLGQINKVGERLVFPFSLQQASEQIRHNLVLLGNTVHSLHPVAGQGFNLAFRETVCLAENISESLRQGCNPGNYDRLASYLQAIQEDQSLTIGFSHYLTKLFSSDSEILMRGRQAGLIGIDLLPALKKKLSMQAMGLGAATADLGQN